MQTLHKRERNGIVPCHGEITDEMYREKYVRFGRSKNACTYFSFEVKSQKYVREQCKVNERKQNESRK